MKARILMLSLILCASVFGQNFWSSTKANQKELKENKTIISGEKLYAIDLEALSSHLRTAPERVNYAVRSNVTVDIPNIDGKLEKFYVAEAPNFSPALQAQFPNIRSYRGVGVNNSSVNVTLSVSPRGIQVMRMQAGQPTTFIEAITTDNSVYSVFEKTEKSENWSCATPDDALASELMQRGSEMDRDADDQVLRDFRLALSCTAEYTIYHGGTIAGALGAMNATMARVNAILENDLAIHLTMIDNNASIIYTNPSTDPYSPASNLGEWNQELQSNLTSVIGNANYDIGHLFGASGGGGNAGCIGCVCDSGKGSAYTSPADGRPEGDDFDVDYVAHEMGHQLGANHTFSRTESAGVNYEPGSGSTIMGYAGITGATDIQRHSDPYFHTGSIRQITTNVKNKTCPTETPIDNQPPSADAGPDYSIPIGTAFVLTGSGSDPDGDNITYCWEQIDSNDNSYSMSFAKPNNNGGALVRSYSPTTVPTRHIPTFDKVLDGDLFSVFESLSNVDRDMNFTLQLRDNNPGIGQTDSDNVRIEVIQNGGAFKITSPTRASTVRSSQNFDVTWNVGATNQSPINTTLVDIYFSTDNGANFTLVADNVANDGEESIAIPANTQSLEARFMVKAVGNIYYAVSEKFTIDHTVTSECYSYEALGLPVSIPDGSAAGGYGQFVEGQFQAGDHGTVDELTVEVDITHSYVSDLHINLKSPIFPKTIDLWHHECTSENNLDLTFDDSATFTDCNDLANGSNILARNLLSQFKNYPTEGTWLIKVRDGGQGDIGTFNSAKITFCNSVLEPLGTNDIKSSATNHITVYPNPSTGVFNFKLNVEGKGIQYAVYDVTGKLIKSFKDANATGDYHNNFDLSSYAKGVYILQVKTGNKIINKKLIVK